MPPVSAGLDRIVLRALSVKLNTGAARFHLELLYGFDGDSKTDRTAFALLDGISDRDSFDENIFGKALRTIDCSPPIPFRDTGSRKMKAPGFLGPCPMPDPATAVPIASGRFVYSSFRIVVPSRASEVFNWVAPDVIVSVSLAAPTCNDRLRPTVLSASTTTPVCSYCRKPGAATLIVYVPGGRGARTYSPLPSFDALS